MADDSDSVDLSDSDEGDYPVPKIGHGTNMDTNLIINDAFTKVKHWRRKYKKCAKEKDKQDTLINTMQDKLKHLVDVKTLYDELKINSDLELRSLQMKLEHENEQAKRSQVLLKQSKASLEDMSGKHREAVDSNKAAESKLCQIRLELASVVSDKGRIEDELCNIKTSLHQTQQNNHQYQITIQNQANKINEVQRDLKQYKGQHTELLSQFREAEELCDSMDKRNASLLQELQMLKTTSSTENTTLSKACSSGKEECLRLISERDSLSRDLTYTRQTLTETQERLRETDAGYKSEKRTAEEKTICLKQTEMSLEHMQAMFSEKECQYKDTTTRLTSDIVFKENELKLTKEDLREAQSLRGLTSSNSSTQNDQIATLNTELGHLRATAEHLNTNLKQLEDEKARAIERCNKMSDEHNAVMKTNNELELEMSKQREAFKEEVRGVKNDMKIAENKHEVIQKKLLSAREQIGTLERESRALQSTVSEKSALHSKLDNDMSLIRSENTVLKHSTSENKESARQALTEIEGLKARIIVLQEENKSIRQRSDETMHKLTEKDIAAQGLQNKLNETIQSIHVEHLQNLEEAQQQKEQVKEKIYQVQNELSQVKFEKEARENQIRALTEQIHIRDSKEVKNDTAEVSYFNPDDSERCQELSDKCRELENKNHNLKSEKIMADNTVVQLKHALETEREKMEAAEQAIRQTTESINTMNNKQGGVTEELYKARNEIFRVEELLKLEKEKRERCREEKEEFVKHANIVEGTLAEYKDQIYKIKDQLKEESVSRQSLQQEVEEKERQLQSEAKLRLLLSAQIGSAADQDSVLFNEKRKVEKLEEKCAVLLEQLERDKRELETEVASRKLAEGQLSEYSDKIKDLSGSELKIKNMKQKLANEREVAKKTQDDLIRKVKKCQLALKEEAKERKQITENYMNLKSEVGEMQGKMTVLLSEAERLKIQRNEAIQDKRRADDELSVLQSSLQRDYCPKIESQMVKKNVEAQTRVEMKRRLHEMNMKIESESKSREAIDKFRTETETRIRDELEKTNRDLKSQVEECYETLSRNETQLLNISAENEKLKCILEEERKNSERMYPLREDEELVLPIPSAPTNVQKTQDANTAWLAMKSKLNESLNRYMSPHTEQNMSARFGGMNVSYRERSISPLVSPRPGLSPRMMRTSGDSFL